MNWRENPPAAITVARIGEQLASSLGLGALLALVSAPAAIGNDATIRLAGVAPIDHFGHTMLEQVRNDIEAAEVGLGVQFFPAGQLGSGEELFEDTIRGNVDLVHAFIYAHTDPVLEINSLPYLVSSMDEAAEVYGNKGSPFNSIYRERLDALGIVLLGTAIEGLNGVVASVMPQDYAGIGPKNANIRVWSSRVIKATVEEMGYTATTMNWAEVFPAIQSGAVDGAMCCTAQMAYTVFAQSDVGRYYIPYNATAEITAYYASKKTWERLTDEQRNAIQVAVDRAVADFNAWARTNDREYLMRLEARGYDVLYLTDEQRAAMASHVRETVWPLVADVLGRGVLDRLVSR